MTKGKWFTVGFFVVGTGLWIVGIVLKNWVIAGVIAFAVVVVAVALAFKHFL